jgi:hypothetical protein
MWPRSASLLLESPRSLAISSNMAFIIIAELKYHQKECHQHSSQFQRS